MSDEFRPDDDPTIVLPLTSHDDDASPKVVEPMPPPLEGSFELSSALPQQDVQHADESGDAPGDPVLRSPWTAAPSTTFSTPLASETTGPLPVLSPSPNEPVSTVAVLPAQQSEQVTCPECGTVSTVTLTRREASDFCRNCDYPLFWTPSKILLDRSGLSDESLRRLPGTVGRVTVASFPCPHCAEPNQVSAVDCVRCGLPLRPVRFEAPPAPVYVAPPPEPEPEPEERGVPWWVWFGAALMIITITLVLLYAYNAWPFD